MRSHLCFPLVMISMYTRFDGPKRTHLGVILAFKLFEQAKEPTDI